MSWTEKHLDQVRATVVMVGGRICRDRGWDVEDLVSDVTLVLLRREHTASRYDPRRGSVDVYLRRVTRSVVGHWLEHDRTRKREVTALPIDVAPPPQDEQGLDDGQRAELVAILADARSVVGDVATQVVVACLLGEDLDRVARAASLEPEAVWRYCVLTLARLEKRAGTRWRSLWARHRLRVWRTLRRSATGPQTSRAGA